MDEMKMHEITKKAQKAFKRADKIAQQWRESDSEISDLCREYAIASKVWNWQPYMLRRAVEAQMVKKTS